MGNYKKVYFSLDNGQVVEPTSLPAYCAILDGKEVIILQACYAIANIERNGDFWSLKQNLEEEHAWCNYVWLMKSLKSFIELGVAGEQEDYHTKLSPRYEYVTFWVRRG